MTQPEQPQKPAIATISLLKKWGHVLLNRFRIATWPVIKVYHGFGTDAHIEVSGHVFLLSPMKQERFSTRFWRNTLSLLRLFVVKPFVGTEVIIEWGGALIPAKTDDTGFFTAAWDPADKAAIGWHQIRVHLSADPSVYGEGRIVIPPPTKYAVVSDIDDTFLISHSSDLQRRLYVLLTRNARTRRPFEDVVAHYQLLAKGDDDGAPPRPFFYVSSSEWNLYDYIREFSDNYHLPEGVYLLSALKQLQQFWKTGQGKHKAKYFKIARLLITYPEKQFILLGDDSQEDPSIYHQLVADFPGRIICVYLRHVRAQKLEPTRILEGEIKAAGVEICYFTHSKTAIEHSRKIGLIK